MKRKKGRFVLQVRSSSKIYKNARHACTADQNSINFCLFVCFSVNAFVKAISEEQRLPRDNCLHVQPQPFGNLTGFCGSSTKQTIKDCWSLQKYRCIFSMFLFKGRTLVCLQSKKLSEQMVQKIKCPVNESNPQLITFMTDALLLSY